MLGWPSAAAANVLRLDSRHNQYWPAKHKNISDATFVQRGASERPQFTNVLNVPCFADYHTKTSL
jgi:hypothetical protein